MGQLDIAAILRTEERKTNMAGRGLLEGWRQDGLNGPVH